MVIAFTPFTTGYFSSNLNEPVPTYFYCGAMLVAAALNLKVNWTATSPPMVDESVAKDEIVQVRRRSISVLLGAVTALALSFVAPQAGPIGLISIGIWRRVLTKFAAKPAGA
jgi:uncharacterized membrane protein